MTNYLVVKNGVNRKSYELKTSEPPKPYLKVNNDEYLKLTTSTIGGVKLKVRHDSITYRPLEKTTTIETTGYSGTINGFLITEKYSSSYEISDTSYNSSNIESTTIFNTGDERMFTSNVSYSHGAGALTYYPDYTGCAIHLVRVNSSSSDSTTIKSYSSVPYIIIDYKHTKTTGNMQPTHTYSMSIKSTLYDSTDSFSGSGQAPNLGSPTYLRLLTASYLTSPQGFIQKASIQGYYWRGLRNDMFNLSLYTNTSNFKEVHYSRNFTSNDTQSLTTNETLTYLSIEEQILSSTLSTSNATYSIPCTISTVTEI